MTSDTTCAPPQVPRKTTGTSEPLQPQGPFDETAVSIGGVLAAQVAIAVSRSPEFAAARATVEQAQRDVDDRADVDAATGLLMATQGCTP